MSFLTETLFFSVVGESHHCQTIQKRHKEDLVVDRHSDLLSTLFVNLPQVPVGIDCVGDGLAPRSLLAEELINWRLDFSYSNADSAGSKNPISVILARGSNEHSSACNLNY